MLVNMADQYPHVRCARNNSSSVVITAITELSGHDHQKLCDFSIFIALCNFPRNNSVYRSDNLDNDKLLIDLGPQILADDKIRKNYAKSHPIYHEVNVRNAEQTPRILLVCISRLFAFERWELIIAAMEVYKALGVNLIVLHINSVISSVFELIQAYETEGRLAVRKVILKFTNN